MATEGVFLATAASNKGQLTPCLCPHLTTEIIKHTMNICYTLNVLSAFGQVHKELKSKPKQSFSKKTVNRKHTKEELEYHEKGLFFVLGAN